MGQIGRWIDGLDDASKRELVANPVELAIDLCRLTGRFTPERIWRVCKARAAKRNRVVLPAVTEEAAVA